jgi:hypothetical protein
MLKNQRNLLLGVPKCGSTTAREFLVGELVNKEKPHLLYEDIAGDFDNVYAFWRDPVDRFKSAVKFFKERYEYGRPFDARKIITDFIAGKPPLVLGYAPLVIFKPQCDWYRNVPNLTILPFSEYETSIRFLETIFGSTGADIPRLHKTVTFLELDNDVEEMVRDYYKEDYQYAC